MVRRRQHWVALAVLCALFFSAAAPVGTEAQSSSRTFPETGKTVGSTFLRYWDTHGGLAQQGFPISDEFPERSDTDGKTYLVQYFERAVFEMHSENAAPNDVLLSLLGNFLYKQKYPEGAPAQQPNTSPGSLLFKETGHRVGGIFLTYWQSHGGLAQQGYPISDEFSERSDLDGKTYRVQYFERAVFEYHPEKQPPYNVLLSQLGTFRLQTRYTAQPAPGDAPCTSPIEPGLWSGFAESDFTLSGSQLTGSGVARDALSLHVGCDGRFTGASIGEDYSGTVSAGVLTALSCSAPLAPISSFSGYVEAMGGGLVLHITDGQMAQGTVSCKGIGAPPTRDLAGEKVVPSDVKVEMAEPGKLSGTEWAVNSAYQSLYSGAQAFAGRTGGTIGVEKKWELRR